MKLVFAIVNNEDGSVVMRELNNAGYSVTKMASTGGFLRVGNTTLLAGAEEADVDNIVEIIRKFSRKRKQIIFSPESYIGIMGDYANIPEEIEVGGATVFIVDVEKFEKV